MTHRILAAACLSLLCGGPAFAQVPTVPQSLADGLQTAIPFSTLGELTKALNAGDWGALQDTARKALRQLPDRFLCPTNTEGTCDPTKKHVLLAWNGTDHTGENALLWALVHTPSQEAYTTFLPGLRGTEDSLYEVYLSGNQGAGFASYYISTQVSDPLLTQIPSVAEKIAGPFFALLGGIGGTLPPIVMAGPFRAAAQEAPVYAWARQVALPLPRADIKAVFTAAEPVTLEQFTDNAAALASRLRFNEISDNQCARGFATNLAQVAKGVATEPTNSCAPVPGQSAAQRRASAEKCLKAFDDGFFTALEAQKAMCSADDLKALQVVNLRFRTFVNDWRPEKLKAEVTFKNRPLTHFGFGILSSYAFSGKTKEPRVKVDDGVLVEDPLPRAVTAAVLNYSIPGYNADSSRVGWRERLNLFGGATITPGFGITGGVNFVIVRGLGVNVGGARIYHATKQESDEFGQAPSDANDPLRSAAVNVWFAGLSYAFK